MVALVLVLLTRQGSPGAPAATVVSGCGLTPAPAACGTLRYDPAAKQAVLSVTGLAPVAVVDGRPAATDEVWLVRADGSVTPAAYLSPSPDGRTFTAAMSGDMSQYAAVATTREPFGGSPRPTGPTVLTLGLGTAR